MSCYFLYVGDIVSARSSAASLAMCWFIGHRVCDLSVVGVQGNVNDRRRKCISKGTNQKKSVHSACSIILSPFSKWWHHPLLRCRWLVE